MGLQQGFALGEIGYSDPFARQQFSVAYVRLGLQADMSLLNRDVRYFPVCRHRAAVFARPLWANSRHVTLFDQLVGAGDERLRHGEAECFSGPEIDQQFEFRRLFDRKIGGLRPVQNLVDVVSGAAKQVR